MTKSELIESVAGKLVIPKGKAEMIVNIIFDSMTDALQRGDRIEIRGFGSFEVRQYKAYEGRNPRTGAKVEVKPKRLPFFKVGKELKERVDAGRLTSPTPSLERISPGDASKKAAAPRPQPESVP